VQVDCNASNSMAQLHGPQDRVVIDYAQIPEVLREAVVSAEDRNFFKHGGVDPKGIARAAWEDIHDSGGSQQGGSTITQQYVKQTYLSSERTLTRKLKEAVMAVKLEQKLSKQQILGDYLNTIYFGRGAYGVQAASRVWFGHDVQALTLGEAAFMAGLIRNPGSADPYKGAFADKEARRRRRVVLAAMLRDHYITSAQSAEASKLDPLALVKRPPSISNLGDVQGSEYGTKYFVAYVRRWLIQHFGEDAVYSGGLKVYTTIDRGMQQAAYNAVTSTLDEPTDPAAALVAVDDQGQVKAMMGGTDFDHQQVNLAVGREGGGSGRQPGSTFKAFALAEAVKQGYSIESRFSAPSTITLNSPLCGGAYKVRGGSGGANINLIQATAHSVNTVYTQLALKLGPQSFIDLAKQMGVREQRAGDLRATCSSVLGTGSVSVLDMAGAYSTFADNGVHKSPIVVTRVERPDGTVIPFAPTQTQVLSSQQSALVTYCLQQVVKSGTGVDANFGVPAAGKTGTTQNNHDGWFVGFTPKMTAAVWMGYPGFNGQPIGAMNDVHGIEVEGGTFPARIWHKFMQAVSANQDVGQFPDVPDLNVGNIINPDLGAGEATTVPRSTVPHSSTTTTVQAGSTTSTSKPAGTTSTTKPAGPPTTPTTRPHTPSTLGVNPPGG
jgi:penicillin-binding protein 1A